MYSENTAYRASESTAQSIEWCRRNILKRANRRGDVNFTEILLGPQHSLSIY